MIVPVGSILSIGLSGVWEAGFGSKVVELGIVRSVFSASLSVEGVCSFVVRVLVRSRMLTGLYDMCVIVFNLRGEFSGRVGFRGERINQQGPVEWAYGVRRLFLCIACVGIQGVGNFFFFYVM